MLTYMPSTRYIYVTLLNLSRQIAWSQPLVACPFLSFALRSAPRISRPPLFFPFDIRRLDAAVFVVAAAGMCMAGELCGSALEETLLRPRRAAERAKASTCRMFWNQIGELALLKPRLFWQYEATYRVATRGVCSTVPVL